MFCNIHVYNIHKYTYITVHAQNFFTDGVRDQKRFGDCWSRCSEKDADDGRGVKKFFHKENSKDW